MKVAIFSAKSFEQEFFVRANETFKHDLTFLPPSLTAQTVSLAHGYPAICAFVNDQLNAAHLEALARGDTRLVALRSAGFNNVDIEAAKRCQISVMRVPAYSPHAVAEHTVGMMLTLNRKFHRAFNRVREQNFSLDGLMGFDFFEKTVGLIGTGKIGEVVARIMCGFGCRVVAYDVQQNPECVRLGVEYLSLDQLSARADIISLHCPLTESTRHLIDQKFLEGTKAGLMLINTSRGAVIDTKAAIASLKRGHLGSLGIDVYEEEETLFFRDLSQSIIQDDTFVRLLAFPNVLITAHQGFFTREATLNIAETTLKNIRGFESGQIDPKNLVVMGST